METKLFFCILFFAFWAPTQATGKQAAIGIVDVQTGTIVIEDDVYLIVTGNVGSSVEKVNIFTNSSMSTLVDVYNGCGLRQCEYNLITEGLPTGSYYIHVELNGGSDFYGPIVFD